MTPALPSGLPTQQVVIEDQGLIVDNISISFGGVQALRNVSFQIRPGEIVGLLGPNGSGKTCLINCISRYYHPSSGRILYNGLDLMTKRAHQLATLGMARSFQELSLPPDFSVLDTIMTGQHPLIGTSVLRAIFDFAYLKREDRKYRRCARDLMRFLADTRAKSELSQEQLGYPDINGHDGSPDLLDLQDVPVGVLSYGMSKKVDMARALAIHPRFLLLDEPAAGLGKDGILELQELIRAVHARFQTSILLVEHKMSLIKAVCDRVLVLDSGEKIAEGSPEEVTANPKVIEAYLGKKTRSPALVSEPFPLASSDPGAIEDFGLPILDIKEVDLFYGATKALSGVSIPIRDKGITAILGSNGAGKSSLLKAISGISPIATGEILFKGEVLCHHLQKPRPDRVVRKGVVQAAGRRIFTELSVMENLKVAGYTLGNRKRLSENVEKIFHYFPDLKKKLHLKEAGNLSGGQQQMLAISQALVIEPRLMLLDEPSLGLSPALVQELFEIIQRISKEESCPVVVVEQNAETALHFSDYAYVLQAGSVAISGMSAQLLQDDRVEKIFLGIGI